VDEIGLFPLNLVLVPGEQAPLHIFEPRYRELIAECLDFGADFGDRLFGSLHDLATGVFYTAVLLAVSVWLGKQKTSD